MGFHTVAVVDKLVQKWDRVSYIRKEKQYKSIKQKTNIKRILKNISRELEDKKVKRIIIR